VSDSRASTASCRVRLVGVGSPHGDDHAGWWVAQRLAEVGPREFWPGEIGPRDVGRRAVSIVSVASPVDLLEYLEGVEQLHVCDAFVGDGPPGKLHRWHWPEPVIQQQRFIGSHDISLAATLTLAQNLGRLPDEVVVWGIDVGPTPNRLPYVAEAVQAFGHVNSPAHNLPTGADDRFSTTLQAGLESAIQQIADALQQVVRHA
jgi:hydrogenase maturation protease